MTMIRASFLALALLCAGPALAQQQSDFDLPESAPAPAPTGSGQVQGPVDDSGVIPIGPRVIGPTSTPTSTPAPTLAPSPAPTATPRATTRPPARTAAQPAQRTPTPLPSGRAAPQDAAADPRVQPPAGQAIVPETNGQGPSITDPIVSDGTAAATTAGTPGAASPLPAGLPSSPGPVEAQSGTVNPATPFWWWIVAALAVLAALAAAAIAVRRKQAQTPIVAAPKASPGLMPSAAPKLASPAQTESEPTPEITSASAIDDLPAPAFVHAKIPAQAAAAIKPSPAASRPIAPLGLETKVVRMQRSLRAITVTAQVAVTNRGSEPITDAIIQGDLVGASKAKPLGEQLANVAAELALLEPLGTLQPGERREATVQVRRELPEIEGIQQGNTVVFIPLLRIRFAGEGAAPLASTVLVGHPPERSGGKPTPFLADAPPQNYNNVVGRALG